MDMMTDIPSPLPTLARYAIMVDVGYIYAAAGELLFSSSSRREYRVDTDKLIQALTRQADGQVRGELLRVYWYDAARDRVPTIDQRVIAQMAWVKLRLGNLNARGQQKGVDAQIRADMNQGFVVALASFVESQKSGVSKFVADQVKRWDLAQLTRLIEMNIGKDLQYIRFNGMVIGGLAGLVLYTAERLILLN